MTGEDFQAVILALSEHLKSTDPIELSPEEVQALLAGFQQMAANIGQSVVIIEDLEAKLESGNN